MGIGLGSLRRVVPLYKLSKLITSPPCALVSNPVSNLALRTDVLLSAASFNEAIDCLNRSKPAAWSAEGLQWILKSKRPSPNRGKTQSLAGDTAGKMLGHVSQWDNSFVFSVDHGALSSKICHSLIASNRKGSSASSHACPPFHTHVVRSKVRAGSDFDVTSVRRGMSVRHGDRTQCESRHIPRHAAWFANLMCFRGNLMDGGVVTCADAPSDKGRNWRQAHHSVRARSRQTGSRRASAFTACPRP